MRRSGVLQRIGLVDLDLHLSQSTTSNRSSAIATMSTFIAPGGPRLVVFVRLMPSQLIPRANSDDFCRAALYESRSWS